MTTDLTSNPQSGLDWQDLCLDPYHESVQQGKMQGRKEGALAGFKEGQALGQSKGVEFGIELGFYEGILSTIQLSSNSSSAQNPWKKSERISKSIQQLQEAIQGFPPADRLFRAPDQETGGKVDVMAKMEKIRGRFKLLMVQLGHPHFSLKEVLEDHNPTATTGEVVQESEW